MHPSPFIPQPCTLGPILRQIMQERGTSARAMAIATLTPRASLRAFLHGNGRTPMHYVEAWFSHVGYTLDALPIHPATQPAKQEARQCPSAHHPYANAAR